MDESVHPAIRGLTTICRCNNIKRGTIEKVIRGGAQSVAEVARATTATTGQCGGSCTPDVVTMIDEIHGSSAETPVPGAQVDEDAWWVRK